MGHQGMEIPDFMGTEFRSCLMSVCLFFACVGLALGQSVTALPSQFQTPLNEVRSAVLGTSHPQMVVLDGTFTSTEGSLNQNGSVHLTSSSDGSYAANFSRTVGAVSESRTVSEEMPACTWTDQNNTVHNSSFLNCLSPAWFFPHLALLSNTGSVMSHEWTPSSYSADSLGTHLKFQFALPSSVGNQEDPEWQRPFDLVLTPGTSLPECALFVIHPDTPGISTLIPVKIAYSNYKDISGIMIPFHIQRYVNGSLVLDIEISSAVAQ